MQCALYYAERNHINIHANYAQNERFEFESTYSFYRFGLVNSFVECSRIYLPLIPISSTVFDVCFIRAETKTFCIQFNTSPCPILPVKNVVVVVFLSYICENVHFHVNNRILLKTYLCFIYCHFITFHSVFYIQKLLKYEKWTFTVLILEN